MADAVQEIERTEQAKPDEIYLLSSAIDAFWSLWSLRVENRVFDNLSIWGEALDPESDPATLTDLTGR